MGYPLRLRVTYGRFDFVFYSLNSTLPPPKYVMQSHADPTQQHQAGGLREIIMPERMAQCLLCVRIEFEITLSKLDTGSHVSEMANEEE